MRSLVLVLIAQSRSSHQRGRGCECVLLMP